MVKLVVCDLDGTLIGSDEVLSKKAVDMAERLRAENIGFSLATGRSDYLTAGYAGQLGLSIPHITCNGAALVFRGRRLSSRLMPAAPLRDLVTEADALNLSIVYSINGEESVWRDTPWILGFRRRFNRYHRVHQFTDQEWRTLILDKILIYDGKDCGAINIIETRCKALAPAYTFTRYIDHSVEIVNGTVSKAAGLIDLVNALGISIEDVLAIGDHQNDIEMIIHAGYGAAVGNATGDLKAAADYVCGADMVEGVIEAVNHFCFSPVIRPVP
jgi:Cof subfamily protein (haloacid dehalogenase superfamily)